MNLKYSLRSGKYVSASLHGYEEMAALWVGSVWLVLVGYALESSLRYFSYFDVVTGTDIFDCTPI